MKKDNILFERKLVEVGSSTAIFIPPELLRYIGGDKGNKIFMMADESKHGKFISFWVKR